VGKRLPLLGAGVSGFWTARRMRSEITWPKRLPEALARVTAASYASSSRVTVVLIARYTDAVIHKCQHSVTHAPRCRPRLKSCADKSRHPSQALQGNRPATGARLKSR